MQPHKYVLKQSHSDVVPQVFKHIMYFDCVLCMLFTDMISNRNVL